MYLSKKIILRIENFKLQKMEIPAEVLDEFFLLKRLNPIGLTDVYFYLRKTS